MDRAKLIDQTLGQLLDGGPAGAILNERTLRLALEAFAATLLEPQEEALLDLAEEWRAQAVRYEVMPTTPERESISAVYRTCVYALRTALGHDGHGGPWESRYRGQTTDGGTP